MKSNDVAKGIAENILPTSSWRLRRELHKAIDELADSVDWGPDDFKKAEVGENILYMWHFSKELNALLESKFPNIKKMDVGEFEKEFSVDKEENKNV